MQTFIKDGKTFAKWQDLYNWSENPRRITLAGMARLKEQIQKHEQYKPLLVTPEGEVLGGNMRLKAFGELGIEDIWVSVVNPKTAKEKIELALSDNDEAGYTVESLVRDLQVKYPDVDWHKYSASFTEPVVISELLEKLAKKNEEYSRLITAPVYEVKGEKPALTELVDTKKADELIKEIAKAKEIDPKIRDFLWLAATRLYVFDYGKIAEYYAQSEKPTQELMEKLALVIIDFEKAIQNGYVELIENLMELNKADYDE